MANVAEDIFNEGYATGFVHALELMYVSLVSGTELPIPDFLPSEVAERIRLALDRIDEA